MEQFNLDKSLIELQDKNGSFDWTIRDAVEGVQIFGGIGSGKTSGSGRLIALKYLLNGFGGLVLTAKPDEKELWQEYCQITGRTADLLIIEPGGNHHFNFLEYESSQTGGASSITGNLVDVLKTVIRASEEKSGGRNDDQFWETALDMLLHNVIDLCLLAFGKVSIQDMYDIVQAAPKRLPEGPASKQEKVSANPFSTALKAAKKKVDSQVIPWREALSEEERKKLEDPDAFEEALLAKFPDARLLQFIHQFFLDTYKNLSEKTRSIIDFSFSGFLFHLLKDPVYSLFCRFTSTVRPEDSLAGKIILVNLPVKEYHKIGRDSQIMFKYIWQRAMEKRQIKDNDRPLFLWADEAQNFLHEHDADYQATARSSRIATVYISQNLPNYHASMGGNKSEYRVKSFLGTMATKIFHANADIDTNKYASDLFGEGYAEDYSRNTVISGQFSAGQTVSFKLEKIVRPDQLASLKTGGPKNNFRIEGYMHKQGNSFPDGRNFRRITFEQKTNS